MVDDSESAPGQVPIAVVVGLPLLVLSGLICTLWAVSCLALADYPMAVLGGCAAVVTLGSGGLAAWTFATLAGTRWTRVSVDASGTTIRRQRGYEWLVRGVAAALGIGGLLLLVWRLQDRPGLPLGLGLDSDDWVVTGIVAICGLVLVYRTFGLAGTGSLRLTPDGLHFRGVVSRSVRVRWDEVVGIAEAPCWPLNCQRADGTEVQIAAQVPQSTNHGLYRLIRHYWANPADRAELTDERVVARLAALRR